MIAINATTDDLHEALKAVNKRYKNNVIFNRLDYAGRRIRFTLKVKDSKKPGHRIGFSGRRMVAACWHVHGHFLEELFKIIPDAEVISSGAMRDRITKNGSNWQDWNIGPRVQPLYYSDACDCE